MACCRIDRFDPSPKRLSSQERAAVGSDWVFMSVWSKISVDSIFMSDMCLYVLKICICSQSFNHQYQSRCWHPLFIPVTGTVRSDNRKLPWVSRFHLKRIRPETFCKIFSTWTLGFFYRASDGVGTPQCFETLSVSRKNSFHFPQSPNRR